MHSTYGKDTDGDLGPREHPRTDRPRSRGAEVEVQGIEDGARFSG
jgi:hypothetical protein